MLHSNVGFAAVVAVAVVAAAVVVPRPLHGLEPAEAGERVALETGRVHLGPAFHRVEPVEAAGERLAVETVGVHLGPAFVRLRRTPQQVGHGRRRSRHRPAGRSEPSVRCGQRRGTHSRARYVRTSVSFFAGPTASGEKYVEFQMNLGPVGQARHEPVTLHRWLVVVGGGMIGWASGWIGYGFKPVQRLNLT